MSQRSHFLGIAFFGVFCGALPAFGNAGRIAIPNNTVVPVTFLDELNLKENRAGDRFLTIVRDDRDFPRGTKLEGRIVDIRPQRKDNPAYMDLEFTRVLLPNGTKAPIHAVPIKMDLENVSKGPDGRYTATKKVVRNDQIVVGGTVAGAVLGNFIKKPFEGAFLGALAGIVAVETNKNRTNDVVIERNAKMGALIEQDFNLDSYSGPNAGGDRDKDADSVPRILFRGRTLVFADAEQPYRLDDTVMVPLESAADAMRITVEQVSHGVILLESDETMLRIEQDSKNYRLNGKWGSFPRSVVNKKGVVYVPIEALSMMKVGEISVNGTYPGDHA